MSSTKNNKSTSLTFAISATLTTLATVSCVPLQTTATNQRTSHPTTRSHTQSNTVPAVQNNSQSFNTNIQANPQQQQITAFSNSQYSYDDAALLAKLWGEPTPWDAKLRIGNLIINHQNTTLQQELTNAKQYNAFSNSSYSGEDLTLLAKFWGKPTPWDTKLQIGSLLLNGNNSAVQQALNNAKQNQAQDNQQQQANAFSNSQYSYDDATLLANFWGKSTPWDAKLKIGSLLLNGNNTAVQQALNNAHQTKTQFHQANQEKQQSDAFFNSQYSYQDAVHLANFWGTATPWDAKLKIGSLLLSGNNAAVQQALRNAGF